MIWLVFIAALLPLQDCAAQNIDRLGYRRTDSLVTALGPMRDSSLKSVIRSITPFCRDQACLIRAIYMWVATYITYDCAGERRPGQVNSSASYVFTTRVGDSRGYAGLVAEMCRIAGITCEIVAGVAKSDPADIAHVDNNDHGHFWNVVNVKDRWYVLDASWGAGFCTGRQFTKQLTDAWFLTNRKLFALCHYPKNKRSQLLDTPVERSAFVAAPVVYPLASIIGLLPLPGQRGVLRGRQDSSVKIAFTIKPVQRVIRTAIVAGGVTIEIPFSVSNDTVSMTVPFPQKGKYPVMLLVDTEFVVNGGPAFGFRAEASPRVSRRTGK